MALDKLVDSTQLDSDLTSVANAIRTKGGTSAQLAFPTDFISAIGAISGGGGVTAAAGTVTVLSEVASPAATESFTFPGIQLDFQPDFIFVCLDNASTSAIKSTARYGHLYWCVCAKREILPIFRLHSSSTTDNFSPSIPILAFGQYQFSNSVEAPTGYGVPQGSSVALESRIILWGLNADGTFSYGQFSGSAGTALNPGTYRYFAFKVT